MSQQNTVNNEKGAQQILERTSGLKGQKGVTSGMFGGASGNLQEVQRAVSSKHAAHDSSGRLRLGSNSCVEIP